LNSVLSAAEILRELVAIPTPSAVSNLPVLRWVEAFLEHRGWRAEILPYLDDNGVEKANLIARANNRSESKIDLAFICHTDTVPYSADWPAALSLEKRNADLHGCGSCDVKGALACFLAAASGLNVEQMSQGVALVLTADEEIGCKGMERLLAAEEFRGVRIGSAIVSEPTSLRPGIAGKGYGLARITVQGREAHSAFPEQGVSAISVAARLISQIEDAFATGQPDAASDGLFGLFDPPRTTLNIGVIEGGTAKNIIPGRCAFLVEWRALPNERATDVLNHLEALVYEAKQTTFEAQIDLEGLRAEAGFSPAEGGPLRSRLADNLPAQPVGISFGSEASRVTRIADEVIVIGPGDMRTAHSDRECVPIVELVQWTVTLRDLLQNGI